MRPATCPRSSAASSPSLRCPSADTLSEQYQQRISARSAPPRDADGDERCDVLSNLLRACAVAGEAQLMEDESGDDLACETPRARRRQSARTAKPRRGRAKLGPAHAAAGAVSDSRGGRHLLSGRGVRRRRRPCVRGALARGGRQARLACPPRPARQLGAAVRPWAAVKSDNA